MRLYVEEIKDQPIIQHITKIDETICLDRVRLHLCKYLSPAGTFTVEILDSSDNVLASKSQTLAEMQAEGSAALSASYYHGHVSFVFDRKPTLRPGDYKIKLTATGYTYAEGEFLGWCKAWVDRAFETTSGEEPDVIVNSPFDFELYSLMRIR